MNMVVKLSILSYISKFLAFFKFKNVSLFISFIVLSLLFWQYSPNIAFNDIHVFAKVSSRIIALSVFWSIVFIIFVIVPMIRYFISFKSEKRGQIRELKKLSSDSVNKAKRNFFISIKDAKNTWKSDLKLKKIPLIMIIGNERVGKSAFINYSNIEYPLGDSLETYKKIHQSTTNFNLYISKDGALIDTEGVHFSQENLFNPTSTDELPEDDIEKNKDFLLKKNIWREFLNFLNKNIFHSKLNGAILIIDTQQFLENSREYFDNLIRYLVKRVNDCESSLKIKFPIYVVFSKLDLIDGMGDYFKIFNENIANKALGLSLSNSFTKDSLNKDFKELSESLLFNIMNKNSLAHSLEDKKRSYLFLKQLDNLFALVEEFMLKLKEENSLKNGSPIKGVYFVSAFQENIPRNYLINTICEKYNIKKPLTRAFSNYSKQSYFVKSLLKDIVFKHHLMHTSLNKNFATKFLNIIFIALIGFFTYFASNHFLETKKLKEQASQDTLLAISSLLDEEKYASYTPTQKIELLHKLKDTLKDYPRLFSGDTKFEYPLLDISYKGFESAKKLYYELSANFLRHTILVEMENILNTESNLDKLIRTFYMYKSLFDKKFINVDLFKFWVNSNWDKFEKYNINKNDFLSYVDIILNADFINITQNDQSVNAANSKLAKIQRPERLYSLLEFISYKSEKELYNLKQELTNFEHVVQDSSNFDPFNKIYTKNGMKQFLSNLSSYIDNTTNIEKWLMGENEEKNIDKNNLKIEVVKLYLQKYDSTWSLILSDILPKKFNSRADVLNELEILSKTQNPINSMIDILNDNTNLNNDDLLKFVYSLGFPSTEIKKVFSNFSTKFQEYHSLKNENNNILETISGDISKIHKKILDFNFQMLESESDKITYVVGGVKNENDPFIVLNNNSKLLPKELTNYYQRLSQLSWQQIESGTSSILNSLWYDEVYNQYANEILPFYPFNPMATESVSIESFKSFFGKKGTWNQFYKRYLNKILAKNSKGYYVKSAYRKDFNFSQRFLKNAALLDEIANIMLDSDDRIKINFYLKAVDLSADFSNINISYGNNERIVYDHTIPSSLHIMPRNFDTSTQLKFIAKVQNENKTKQKIFNGEWAWYRLIEASTLNQNSVYSLYLDMQKESYFGFEITSNNNEILKIMDTIRSIRLPKSIL